MHLASPHAAPSAGAGGRPPLRRRRLPAPWAPPGPPVGGGPCRSSRWGRSGGLWVVGGGVGQPVGMPPQGHSHCRHFASPLSPRAVPIRKERLPSQHIQWKIHWKMDKKWPYFGLPSPLKDVFLPVQSIGARCSGFEMDLRHGRLEHRGTDTCKGALVSVHGVVCFDAVGDGLP